MPLEVKESEFRLVLTPNTVPNHVVGDAAIMRRLVVIPFNSNWTNEQVKG